MGSLVSGLADAATPFLAMEAGVQVAVSVDDDTLLVDARRAQVPLAA